MNKVVLVEPEIPENTGFIFRLASNFEADIRIVNPEFNLSKARQTANKSQEKIREARIFKEFEESIKDLEHVVGTKPGKGSPLGDFQPRQNSSLVIGRESSGLKKSELEICDSNVYIDTGNYSSINQSHATAILMHGFYTKQKEKADLENLEAIKEDVGNKTMELIKRGSPTEKEVKAIIAEVKGRK